MPSHLLKKIQGKIQVSHRQVVFFPYCYRRSKETTYLHWAFVRMANKIAYLFRYCRTRNINVKWLPDSYRFIPFHSFRFYYIRDHLGYHLSVINPAFVLASQDKRHPGHQLRTLTSARSPKWNYERSPVDMPQVARKWQSTWISPTKGQVLTQEINDNDKKYLNPLSNTIKYTFFTICKRLSL